MISENRSHQLPLFGHFCCRLAAQPDCVSQESCSGDLTVLDGGTGRQWVLMWGQLQAFRLDLWVKREHWEQGQDPVRSIAVDRVSATELCWPNLYQLLATSNCVKLRISEIALSSRETYYILHVLSSLVLQRNRPHSHLCGLCDKDPPPPNLHLSRLHWKALMCSGISAESKVKDEMQHKARHFWQNT
jgi:hypothetical protein